MSARDDLKFFMEPRSIALVGVPRRTGRLSLNSLENLLEFGFEGKIYPVNPSAEEIMGVRTYPSLLDIPDEIDLAVIATPRPAVLGVVEQCAQKGIKAVAVVTQGFSDFDEEGRAIEAEMVRVVRRAGGRVLGPNTVGVANAFAHMTTCFTRSEVTKVPVGVITQTGSFFTGTQGFLPSGKTIDLGNTCDVDFADGLEYFEDDPEVKVIGLYIEGIRNGKRFMKVATRVAKKKPILALKSGRSHYGRKAAQSHTGQLAGRDEIYGAVMRQCGIIRVADIEEEADLARAFCVLPLMGGRGLGVVTMSGSGGVLAADACDDYGLEMAELMEGTRGRIKAMSLPWVNISNPIDIFPAILSDTSSDFSERYLRVSQMVLDIVAADPTVHGILFIAGVFNKRDEIDPSDVVANVADRFRDKPIVCVLHGRNAEEIRARLEATGKTLVFPSFERAVRALGRLRQYAIFREGMSHGATKHRGAL